MNGAQAGCRPVSVAASRSAGAGPVVRLTRVRETHDIVRGVQADREASRDRLSAAWGQPKSGVVHRANQAADCERWQVVNA